MVHALASKRAMLLGTLVSKLLNAEPGCASTEDLIGYFSSYLRATEDNCNRLPGPTAEAGLYALLQHCGRDLDCIPLKRLIQRLLGQVIRCFALSV